MPAAALRVGTKLAAAGCAKFGLERVRLDFEDAVHTQVLAEVTEFVSVQEVQGLATSARDRATSARDRATSARDRARIKGVT